MEKEEYDATHDAMHDATFLTLSLGESYTRSENAVRRNDILF